LTIAGRGYNSWDWPIAGQSALSVSVGKVLRVLPQASGETFFTSSGIGGIWAVGSDGLIQRENTTGLRGITRIDTTDGGRLFGHLTGAEVSELQPDATRSLIRFAGEARTGLWGDGGPATDAFIWRVQDVAVDSIGNLYVPEGIMHKVRVVLPTGTISTFAGTRDIGVDGDGGPATQARIACPTRVDVGPQFDVYFDYPHGMRHVNPAGTITSWPSTTSWCSSSSGCPGDGQPTARSILCG